MYNTKIRYHSTKIYYMGSDKIQFRCTRNFEPIQSRFFSKSVTRDS